MLKSLNKIEDTLAKELIYGLRDGKAGEPVFWIDATVEQVTEHAQGIEVYNYGYKLGKEQRMVALLKS